MNVVKRNYSNGYPVVMDQFFKDILGGTQYTQKAVPPVNIKETEQSFTISLVAPGLKKDAFAIEVDKKLLTISHTVAVEEVKEGDGQYTRKEFTQNSFKRSFTLPENVNETDINAVYQDGVLNITLPKKKEAQQETKRVIEVL
ncbi:hypothetical protein Q765_05430 [Flavobacterium rivuli WB 3.3-2 = DSM 21788]|uniref:SHSP domain-containing protein n=1 Tax=Flavobacterium rivuli WB 3.3-2 = DSM 21788 TaxID=1121895 RepID=A0A0A2M7G3_9FLAO|nr:Hsp20/alpha crystallin family protein [Flavobacterium rivuli]KGO87576.1 hypothetical protein Q765_05430 [Flavobacterium rivuli WB 3.3-2 = DSM 21788]